MRRVLDDVQGGHGGGGEAMYPEGFELALHEVSGDEEEGENLGLSRRDQAVVDVGPQEEEEGVDKHGTKVFD